MIRAVSLSDDGRRCRQIAETKICRGHFDDKCETEYILRVSAATEPSKNGGNFQSLLRIRVRKCLMLLGS